MPTIEAWRTRWGRKWKRIFDHFSDLCLLFYSLCSFWFLPGIVERVLEGQKVKYLYSHWVATMSCCGHPWPLRGKVCEFFKNHPFYPEGTLTVWFLDFVNAFSWGPFAIPKGHPRSSPHRQPLYLYSPHPSWQPSWVKNLQNHSISVTCHSINLAQEYYMNPCLNKLWKCNLFYQDIFLFVGSTSCLLLAENCLGQRMKTDWKGSQGEES